MLNKTAIKFYTIYTSKSIMRNINVSVNIYRKDKLERKLEKLLNVFARVDIVPHHIFSL